MLETSVVNPLQEYEVSDEELCAQTSYLCLSDVISYPSEVTTDDVMNVIEASGALDFWNDPAEDVYEGNDGDAV